MQDKQRSTQPRILVIDDDDSCEMMTYLLGYGHYQVTCAQTVAEGWRLAQSQTFDLCLLESFLLDGNGYELCERIRVAVPHLPVVFYSSAAYEKDRQRGLASGAQAYLVKPNDLDEVATIIDGLLGKDQPSPDRSSVHATVSVI